MLVWAGSLRERKVECCWEAERGVDAGAAGDEELGQNEDASQHSLGLLA